MKKIKFLVLLLLLQVFVGKLSFAEENKDINIEPSRQKVVFDGKVISNIEAHNVDGSNYFKLRDVAAIITDTEINFDVVYNEDKKSVEITRNKTYKKLDSDLKAEDSDDLIVKRANPVAYIDGEKVLYKGYLINNNNFFKLRDLGRTIGFYVSYDDEEDSIIIKSEKLEPKDLIEREVVDLVNISADLQSNIKEINNKDKQVDKLLIDDFLKDLNTTILITKDAKRLSVIDKHYDQEKNNIVLIPDFKYKGKMFISPILKLEQDDKAKIIKLEKNEIYFDLLKEKTGINPEKDFKLTLGYYEGEVADENFRPLSRIDISY